MLLQLVGRALSQHPWLNSEFDSEGILVYETVNIAIAVASPHGLMAPVIHEVEKRTLQDINQTLRYLSQVARENRLNFDQISGATFTISNLGMYSITQFIPLINPPQAAILGVGAVREVLLPTHEGVFQPTMVSTLTVSADHRVLDGEVVAQFLMTLQEEVKRAEFRL
jgi:pyruvate dehydrogenase E2 component (dihydrolipoamide acetyltransferase)